MNGFPYVLIFIQNEGVYFSSLGNLFIDFEIKKINFLATATAMGTDVISMSLIFGLLIYKYFYETPFELNYKISRDILFYIMGYVIIGAIYISNSYDTLMCLVFLAFFLMCLSF